MHNPQPEMWERVSKRAWGDVRWMELGDRVMGNFQRGADVDSCYIGYSGC